MLSKVTSLSKNISTLPLNLTHSFLAIYLIKRRLYVLLRNKLDRAWNMFIKSCVENLNNSPNKGVGYLVPSLLHGVQADSMIRAALLATDKSHTPEPNYPQQIRLQKEYINSKNVLMPGAYVLLNIKDVPFFKSYDQQVSPSKLLNCGNSISLLFIQHPVSLCLEALNNLCNLCQLCWCFLKFSL